jgi:phospho-N-acetylmuramoyl-pentapeptide-transferase
VVGQVGIIVGTVLYFSPSVTVRTDTSTSYFKVTTETVIQPALTEEKSTATTIPFFKIMNLIMLNY